MGHINKTTFKYLPEHHQINSLEFLVHVQFVYAYLSGLPLNYACTLPVNALESLNGPVLFIIPAVQLLLALIWQISFNFLGT